MTRQAPYLLALAMLLWGLHSAQAAESLRIRIVNDAGGPISVSRDAGRHWVEVGEVVRYTTQVTRQGYTASKWVAAGQVAATAVNALHISAGYNSGEDRGVVFSLLPREFLAAPKSYRSFLSPDSSIYTNLPAGRSIFGGGEAPLVGSRVSLERDGQLVPLPSGYLPARGDTLVIAVTKPERSPSEVVFDNVAGGKVTLVYQAGERRQIGWVVKPVHGIGRFVGGLYAAIGRIRANHAGVIDVSTSPTGALGGFQIIPFGHALSPEMATAWTRTQWLIVGPVDGQDGIWEDITPLFREHVRPDYLPGDLQASDWESRLLARFLVDVDIGKGWQPLQSIALSPDPETPLPDWAGRALEEVRRLRILFPLAERNSIDAAAAAALPAP